MRAYFLAVSVIATSVPAVAADSAVISMVCVNPKLSMTVSDHQTVEGRGTMSTPPVQFNVNQGAKAGSTIFVDGKNNGVCDVTLGNGYVFLKDGLSSEIVSSEMESIENQAPPSGPVATVSSQWLSNQKIRFSVIKGINIKGSSTIVFSANYKKAE